MKLRLLLLLASLGLSSLSAQNVFTTFTIPDGSSNTGSFSITDSFLNIDYTGLNSLEDLSNPGSDTHNYAWQYFTPTVTGTYAIGVKDATFDPVLILYSGVKEFPSDPSAGAMALNDDGNYTIFNGLTLSNTSVAPTFNPIIENKYLTAGSDYLVAITSYYKETEIPLPASFFIYGPSQVGVAGAPAVPEPSTYAALAGLAVFGFVAYRRRQSRV